MSQKQVTNPLQVTDEPSLDVQSIYQGRVIEVEEHTVRLPNGRTAKREIVRHPGAVAIVAQTLDNRLVLVSQFRKGPDKTLLEIPAGKLEPGEDPADCARRELAEETGFVPGDLQLVYSFYTSPGFADERISLFYARDLSAGPDHPDEDEFVTVHALTADELRQMLGSGQVDDAKTLVGLLWWLYRRIDTNGP